MTTSINTDQYPFFSPGQILKHSDLNNLTSYLDKQTRLTRVYAVGMGVVADQGLEVTEKTIGANTNTNIKNCIHVTGGVGLSSDGYMFTIPQEGMDLCYYKKDIRIPIKAFTSTIDSERYTGDTIDVIELQQDDENGFIALPVDEVERNALCENKVLVLLWFREEKERTPCFNECDEKGSDFREFFRVVLVDKDQLPANSNGSTGGGSNAILVKETPFIQRFGVNVSQNELNPYQDYSSLYTRYRQICIDAIGRIDTAYKEANDLITSELVESELFSSLKAQLLKLLNDNFPASVDNEIGLLNIQYFYDYLKDLILAHAEFADAACDVIDFRTGGVPDVSLHPGHLKLGVLQKVKEEVIEREEEGISDDVSEESTTTTAISTNECRDIFFPSVLQEANSSDDPRAERKLRFLFERMEKLATLVNVLFLTKEQARLKITPSKGIDIFLSERAIPFYYQYENFKNCWNFRKQQLDWTPAYSAAPGVAPFDNPFLYDLDQYNFFRIEGIWGKPLDKTVKELMDLQRQWNLPFGIQCVKLEGETEFFDSFAAEEYEDLQLIYHKAKDDLLCILEKMDGSFSLKEFLPDKASDFIDLINFPKFITSYRSTFPKRNTKDDCQLEIFIEIHDAYNKRISGKIFSVFANEHPGLEHGAGVSKGGTFILAYVDELTEEVEELIDLYNTRTINDKALDEKKSTLNKIERLLKKDGRGVNKTIVADFYLPYNCCNAPLTNSTPIVEPMVLLTPRSFEDTDEAKYEIMTYPADAKLTASPVNSDGTSPYIIFENEKYYFIPQNVPPITDESLKVILTCTHDDLTATQTIEVQKGPDEIEKPDIIRVGSSVKPIYDTGQNCKLVAHRMKFKIANFKSKLSYAYLLNNIRTEFEGANFEIEVPLKSEEFTFFVIASDKDGRSKRGDEKVGSQCDLIKKDKLQLEIENEPAAIHPGAPDELIVIAEPAGGVLEVRNEKDGTEAFVEVFGTCGNAKFKVDTLNLKVDETYTITYQFPACDFIAEPISFKVTEAPTPEAEKKAEEAKDIAESAEEKAVAAEKKAAAAEQKAIESETKAKEAEQKAAENEKKVLEAEKIIADLLALHKAKPIPENSTPLKQAKRVKSTKAPKKKASIKMDTTILNKRLAQHQELMKSHGEDKNLTKTKSFGLAMSFVLFPGNDVNVLNTRFKEVAKNISSSIKRSSGDRATKYSELMTTVLHNFLDKQVVWQNEKLDEPTHRLLSEIIKELKTLDFDLAKAKKGWKANGLKKALEAKVIDAILKMMK